MAILTGLLIMLWGIHTSPRVLEWDFSQGHDISIVDWSADRKQDWYWLGREKIYLTAKLADEKTYKSNDVADIFLDRRGSSLSRLAVNEHPITLKAAIDRVRALGQEWGFKTEGIDGWQRRAMGGDLSLYSAGFPTDGSQPDIRLTIHPVATSDLSWYVQLEIYWPPKE